MPSVLAEEVRQSAWLGAGQQVGQAWKLRSADEPCLQRSDARPLQRGERASVICEQVARMRMAACPDPAGRAGERLPPRQAFQAEPEDLLGLLAREQVPFQTQKVAGARQVLPQLHSRLAMRIELPPDRQWNAG